MNYMKIRWLVLPVPMALCLAPGLSAGQQSDESPRQVSHTIEGYVSEDALQAIYSRDLDVEELGNTEAHAGFFINEDRDLIMMLGVLAYVGDRSRRTSWTAQFGARAYGALIEEDQDVFGVGIGGKVSYHLGRDGATSISLSAYYAPDIVTFGVADNVTDVGVEIETELTDSFRVFIGYRTFELDLPVDREVDDGVHLGLRGEF